MELSGSWATKQPLATRVGAAEAVIADLRAAIERGELAVGVRLPSEATLATRYGVSRSVVREALRSTTALGLTETRTGVGTFVVSQRLRTNPVFGEYSVTALREARPYIEVPAAGLAARRRTAAQLRRLWEMQAEMDADADPRSWVVRDASFHLLIAQASGNEVFAAFISEIRDALSMQSRIVNVLPDRRHASGTEHRAIIEAIDKGAVEAAEEAMTRHLQHVEDALTGLLPDPSSGTP